MSTFLVFSVFVLLFILLNKSFAISDFIGKEHWDDEFLELCDAPMVFQDPAAKCMILIKNFQEIHVEILSSTPAVLIYRDLVDQTKIDNFLQEFEKSQVFEQTIHSENGEDLESTVRRANGTFMEVDENLAAINVFRKMKSSITGINFGAAEPFSLLSYHPGGHYAPHFDYLSFDTPQDQDLYTHTMGNRFATLILTLKRAERGGATVFPVLGMSVAPMPGDVLVWFNVDGGGGREIGTLHGGCPVWEGEKVISTLWIRELNQKTLKDHGAISVDYLGL